MGLRTLLASIAAAATFVVAKPGTVEVDLIFPRNETYKPDPLFPLVFSFRDPNNASANLSGFSVTWALYPFDGTIDFNNSDDNEDEPPASFRRGMITIPPGGQNTPQYLWDSIEGPTSNATKWWLQWFPLANCTGDGRDDEMMGQNTAIHFTTDEHGSAYSIVPNDCKDVQAAVINITAQSGEEAASGSADPYCGYAAGPLPEADPCGAKISSDEAKKIVDAATSKACHADKPVVSCTSDSGAGTLTTSGMSLAAAFAAGILIISL